MGAGAYCLEVVKMEWLFLLLAGILEVTWAVFMKMSEGFTKLLPSVITEFL
jgi:quaternary ammonium compound-resistance protein SugE